MKRALTLCTCVLFHALAGCAPAPRPAARVADAEPVTMRFDYAGAEAIMDALEKDSLSDADVDALLTIHGVRAMVDNVTRFVPAGVPEFRRDIQAFVRTKRGDENSYFQLGDAWRQREQVRALLAATRRDSAAIVRQMLSRLEPYRPDTGPLDIGVHFVAGGVSDGFAFEDDPPAFYANLVRAQGDLHGLLLNALHETYHVMQMAAQRRSGTFVAWITDASVPPVERLLAGTLVEGTANLVADPTGSTGPGPDMDRARARYARNTAPARVAENFALFDRVLREVGEGRMSWDSASWLGLSRNNDDRFYFVGYEMARAIERYCGPACIGRLFDEPPVEFFRKYIALYREHPEIGGRFSAGTERALTPGG
ncbi:MAG TPA: DUF5700 domain-containing putative Zn-dependent protease [Longimicrobium sp.]|nr:DUF5700 domain-containing putative Zn-dependent protease [Longimicrobium sp.]